MVERKDGVYVTMATLPVVVRTYDIRWLIDRWVASPYRARNTKADGF